MYTKVSSIDMTFEEHSIIMLFFNEVLFQGIPSLMRKKLLFLKPTFLKTQCRIMTCIVKLLKIKPFFIYLSCVIDLNKCLPSIMTK